MRLAVPPEPAAGGMQQGAEGEFVGPLPAVLQSGVSRERFRTGDRLNQVRHRFTVHRRARILGVERDVMRLGEPLRHLGEAAAGGHMTVAIRPYRPWTGQTTR